MTVLSGGVLSGRKSPLSGGVSGLLSHRRAITAQAGQYYVDDALSQPLVSDNAKTEFYSAQDVDYVPPNIATVDDITLVMNGMLAFWDGKLYVTGQTWINEVPTPTDGAAQTDYDVFLGGTSSAAGDDPTFSINKWAMSGGQFFSASNGNPATIKKLHKTSSAVAWTWFGRVQTGASVATLNTLFATCATAGDYGIVIRADSSGRIKVDQYDGTTLHTKQTPTVLAVNTVYNIIVTYDPVLTTLAISVDGKTFTSFNPTGWTAAVSTDASGNFRIGSDTTGGHKMPNGTIVFGSGLLDHAINVTELGTLSTWLNAHYANTLNPAAPGQVIGLVAQASDTAAYLAWAKPSDGGAAISDYTIQYKTAAAGSWTTFSHTASTNQFCQITGLTNGTTYDFRVAGVNSLGTGPNSNVVIAVPVVAGSSPYDLSKYYLTIPVNSSGQWFGTAQNIVQPALLTFNDAWFGRANGKLIYNCPDGAAGTNPTDPYARSELRQLTDIPNATTDSDTIKFYAQALLDGTKITVHQIHADTFPAYKLSMTGSSSGAGTLRALTRVVASDAETITVIKSGMTNGDVTVLKVSYTGTTLDFYLDGNVAGMTPNVSIPWNRAGQTGTWYWKRGAYYQDAKQIGTIATIVHMTQSGASTL